jgi:DNA transformation protein and related proteins
MAMPMELQSLPNIGPKMEGWLRQAGIHTRRQLEKEGAVGAYLKIRTLHPNAGNLMALYALYGALNNINCLKLAPEIKEMLREMADSSAEDI